MHIYISGVAGSGLSSIAHFCFDLGYNVSGSDIIHSPNVSSLIDRGLNFNLGQNPQILEQIHHKNKIDVYLYSPSVNQSNLEYQKAQNLNLKFYTQNQLINQVLDSQDLELIAISGTHGKTTVTAMIAWLFFKTNIPNSQIIGSSISFGNAGKYDLNSQFLVYEADEYNRKFLELLPSISVIPTLDYDHPDTYPTKQEYVNAFIEFFAKSKFVFINNEISNLLTLHSDIELNNSKFININAIISENNLSSVFSKINLKGYHNRQNSILALFTFAFAISGQDLYQAIQKIKNLDLISLINDFPGTKRRFEKIYPNLYSDYAHHPVEIKATLQLAREYIQDSKQKLIAVYQPHQNTRQNELKDDYNDCFNLADQVYWLPTFLARENDDLKIIQPQELINNAQYETRVAISNLDSELFKAIKNHLESGDLVLIMGAGSIDQWFRENFNV